MSTEKPLIPVFVPPLATMLAFAEQKKGSALNQSEVEAIRDQSACVMMQPADAEKMAESRGFVDVNPANCWADWHRLRVQMTAKVAANADRSDAERWNVLFHAFVVNPIGSSDNLYTCGLHLLGAPDLIISQPAAKRSATAGQPVASAAITLFRVFANYLLAECPVGKFASGHTFSMERDAPRYRVIWEPCVGYSEDSFFFNPFGRWRFTEP